MKTYLSSAMLAGALCFVVPTMLHASTWNQKTKLTFNQPVQVPGAVLPAGTYTFKLLNNRGANRNIVEIFNGTHLDATVVTAPDKRLHAKGETVLKFADTPPNDPVALRAWFYPGDLYGHEFVYPHDEAAQLSKANNVTVFGTNADLSSYGKEAFTSDHDADAQKMENLQVIIVQPSGQETDLPPSTE